MVQRDADNKQSMTEKKGLAAKLSEYTKSIAIRSIAGIVLLMVIFATVIGYTCYREFAKLTLKQFSEDAILTAHTAANIVDGEDLYRYNLSNGDTGDYRKAYNEIQKLCNSTDSAFIYVIQPDTTDYAHIRFIFSIAGYDTGLTPYEFGYLRETTNDEYREKYRSLYEQRTFSEIVVRDRGYIETGTHITAMIPLRGSDNKVKGILCVQRQLDVLDEARNDFVKSIILMLIISSIIVILGQSLYLGRTLIDPLQMITDEALRFARDNVLRDRKLTDVIHNTDEIGILAESIDQMEERIQNYIDDITKITAERERIGAELQLANRIQSDMLPKDFPAYPGRDEFNIYASMTPAKEVGGDFYDFFLVDDEHLAMVIADVSGKGIPAALFMMMTKILIKVKTLTGCGPAETLETVNNQICSNNREEMFVTVWLGILDLRTGVLTASNAGHEYPVLMNPDGTFEYYKDVHGFVIGGIPDMKYTEYEINMQKGRKLFVYTDGLPEAQNSRSEFLGAEESLAYINKYAGLDPQKLIEGVCREVEIFSDGASRFDDMTMLCIEYCGNNTEGD